jgi:CRP/FNR family transcriptional regulator, cyclic AMP receptor protein
VTSLAGIARTVLAPLPEVTRMVSLRRSTTLFAQGQKPDSLYLIEDGLVKLTRTSRSNSKIILSVCGPGYIVGEEVLYGEAGAYYAEAEVLTESTVLRIPSDILVRTMAANSELSAGVTGAIIHQKRALAEKIEMLCLHDVEYRILFYLAELSSLVKPHGESEAYQLPITQLELADLIGATRETTSTTLNQLERRGLVRLSRRLLTIPSPGELLSAAGSKFESQNGSKEPAVTAATTA